MISDKNEKAIRYEKVVRIIERKDLGGKDKMLLIYILSRESEPIVKEDQFTAEKINIPGKATVPLEQIGEALGRGYKDVPSLRKQVQRLVKKGFLIKVKQSKGGNPNEYRVSFPHKQPQKGASQLTKNPIEAPHQSNDLDPAKS